MLSAQTIISIKMKLRLPPSLRFMFKTAWAGVPDPANESRMMESLLEILSNTSCIRSTGFELLKILLSPNRSAITSVHFNVNFF